tara:strand:- start:21207 stop:22049 length:843 start_codon:yes stop_codon:yes gene_type:complete
VDADTEDESVEELDLEEEDESCRCMDSSVFDQTLPVDFVKPKFEKTYNTEIQHFQWLRDGLGDYDAWNVDGPTHLVFQCEVKEHHMEDDEDGWGDNYGHTVIDPRFHNFYPWKATSIGTKHVSAHKRIPPSDKFLVTSAYESPFLKCLARHAIQKKDVFIMHDFVLTCMQWDNKVSDYQIPLQDGKINCGKCGGWGYIYNQTRVYKYLDVAMFATLPPDTYHYEIELDVQMCMLTKLCPDGTFIYAKPIEDFVWIVLRCLKQNGLPSDITKLIMSMSLPA